jgi:quercetin dioxygenase-like cupin family protein
MIRFTHTLGAGLLLAGLSLSGQALADSCPAGHAGKNIRAPDSTPAKDVTDIVIASIDLAKEPAHIDGRLFRMRRLVIQPGGIVPWHSHGNRPAIIYTLAGTMEEYSSNCDVPIVHTAGSVVAETHDVAHWWKNTGDSVAVIISADLLPTGMDPHTM